MTELPETPWERYKLRRALDDIDVEDEFIYCKRCDSSADVLWLGLTPLCDNCLAAAEWQAFLEYDYERLQARQREL